MPNATVMFLLAGLLGAPPPAEGPARIWRDQTGQQEVEADLLDYNGEQVWLRRIDNRIFVVRPEELSRADQEFLEAEAKRRVGAAATAAPAGCETIRYGPPRKLAELADQRIDESSGLACSRRRPGVFWTHNDSGDDARLYAFDRRGRLLRTVQLPGVHTYDVEDLASLTLDGKPYLLVGDTGNNGLAAEVQILYLIEEPPLDPAQREGEGSGDGTADGPSGGGSAGAGGGAGVIEATIAQVIYLSYEDDHRDCEGLAVDPTTKTILLVTKERATRSYVYALPWPESDPKKVATARQIATLEVPPVTALDVSPDGRRAVVLTYGDAYEFSRAEGEDWKTAFSRPGRWLPMPRRRQGESICYGPDGRTLYLTSEQLPTPLWEVPVAAGEPK